MGIKQMFEKMKYWKLFTVYVLKRFQNDKCSSVAAELTVTSLLALVPLTTVIFSLLALIPDFQTTAIQLQEIVFKYFVPTTGESVQNYLREFVDKAKGMSGFGFLMLLVTALLMMRSIDSSFNHIWRIKSKKSVIRTFLVYWAVLTLGPVLLGSSLFLTSYLQTLPLISEVVSTPSQWMTLAFPWLMETMTFTLMFYIVPNRKVLFKHAIIAAFISASLFELAKSGFALFVESFSTYQLIFGALATIPLFLIWLYLSWSIVLFGAETCYALFSFEESLKSVKKHPFILVLQLLEKLSQAQSQGESVSLLSFKKADLGNTESLLYCLEKLLETNLVVKLENQSYCLKVSQKALSFNTAFELSNKEFPSNQQIMKSHLTEKNQKQLIDLKLAQQKLLDLKIDFIKS